MILHRQLMYSASGKTAPVAHDAVGVMVDDLAVVLVEASRQVRLCCRQPDGVANTLA
jgi:hypothetical protein